MPDNPSSSPEGKQPHEVPERLKGPSTFVIKRLNNGDPLESCPRVGERLQTKCFLVEGNRLHLRTLARVAHASLTYRGEVSLNEFLTTLIDKSMKELVAEDQEEEARGIPPSEPWDRRYAMIAENLGVSPVVALTVEAPIHGAVTESDPERATEALGAGEYGVVRGKAFPLNITEG